MDKKGNISKNKIIKNKIKIKKKRKKKKKKKRKKKTDSYCGRSWERTAARTKPLHGLQHKTAEQDEKPGKQQE